MAKGNKKGSKQKFRKNDSVRGSGGEEPRDRSRPKNENSVVPKAPAGPEEIELTEYDIGTAISCPSEDQVNIIKVFSTLDVNLNETAGEPVVALEQELPTEVEAVEQVALDENNVMPENVEKEGTEETDEIIRESRTRDRKQSVRTASSHSNRESREEKPAKPITEVDLEKKDSEIDTLRSTFIRNYYAKFAGFLDAIDPEVRFVADIGPCDTFDSEGYQGLFDKMKKNGNFEKAWPFDEKFEATAKELTQLFQDIFEKIKLCMIIACAERGYHYSDLKKRDFTISSFWGSDIDPLKELKTLEVILREMRSFIEKLSVECEEMNRFWENVDEYFGVIMPALETFDSKTLAEKRIVDSLSTVYGRKAHGFEVSEDEICEMLVSSFATDGFGDFPTTVFLCLPVFTTAKQLKLITSQIAKMSEVVDIRVKLAGIQAITQIIGSLENVMELMEEMRNEPKVSMKKVFAIDPETFDPLRKHCKRTEYCKIFYDALQVKDDDCKITDEQILSALLCFYLIFPPFEVNMILYKIIGTQADDEHYAADIETIIRVLRQLPSELKERIEVGCEFFSGEITDNQDSMYYQIKHAIQNKKYEISQLHTFLTTDIENPVFSVERVMRMCIKFIESGIHQQAAVSILNLLRRKIYKKMAIPAKFFEDLLLLALSKYSLPDEKSNEIKFNFLDSTFKLVNEFKTCASLEIDEKAVSDRWMDLGHHWFTVLYLSNKYSILKLSTLNISYPWQSADVWDEKDTTCPPDPKKFAILAKVSLAWPDCSNFFIIEDVVAAHVPPEVSRYELYKSMRDYAAGQQMSERWKKNLLKNYDEKIKLSKSSESEQNDGNDRKSEDTATTCLENQNSEEADEDLRDAEPKVEEPKAFDKEDTEVLAEKEESVQTEVAEGAEEDLKDDAVTEEVMEQSENVFEKFSQLKDLTCFIKYYSEKEWAGLPDVVKNEVLRQRKEAGY